MRRLVPTILLCLLLGCSVSGNWTNHLYINGSEAGVPNVFFHESDVNLPLISVLQALGGEWADSDQRGFVRIQLHNKVFNYNIENRILSLETEQPSQAITLLSEKDNPRYVNWLDAEIFVDYSTLENILDAAGILVDIRIDWENERIYIDTLSDESVSRGRFS